MRNYFFKSGIANKLLEETMKKSSSNEKNKLNELVIFLERSANEELYQSKKILEIYKKYNSESNVKIFEIIVTVHKPDTILKEKTNNLSVTYSEKFK